MLAHKDLSDDEIIKKVRVGLHKNAQVVMKGIKHGKTNKALVVHDSDQVVHQAFNSTMDGRKYNLTDGEISVRSNEA